MLCLIIAGFRVLRDSNMMRNGLVFTPKCKTEVMQNSEGLLLVIAYNYNPLPKAGVTNVNTCMKVAVLYIRVS